MPRRTCLGAASIALLAALPARSEEPESTWYGNQTLIVDGAAIAAGAAAFAVAGPHQNQGLATTLGVVAGYGYLFGGPMIHWWHGHLERGFGSLGLRFFVPLATFAIGVGLACSGHYCALLGNSNETISQGRATSRWPSVCLSDSRAWPPTTLSR
jgi:hypothetical protein